MFYSICLCGIASCSTIPLIPENATEKVEFNLSASEGGTAEIIKGLKNVYHVNDELTVKANAFDNYHFAGWSLNEEIVSKNIVYTFKLANDTDLEAVFYIKTKLPIYTHIPTELGELINLYATVDENDYTWLNIESVDRPHYTFNGWYLDSEYTTELNATNLETYLSQDPTPTQIDIYAKLTRNEVTVTFVLYLDDSGTLNEITEGFTNPNVGPFYEGEQLELQDAEMASSETYSYPFSGWYTDQDMTTAYTTVTLENALTVYGKFTKTNITKHTVQWKIDETVVETDTDVVYGANPEYNEETPTKENTDQYTYTFSGWKIENTEDSAIINLTDYKVTEDVVFVAVFASTTNTYAVKFVDYDNTELQSQTLEYGATVEEPSTPRHGSLKVDPRDNLSCYDDNKLYTFKGWDQEVTTVTKDITYKATYDERALKDYSYTIKVVGNVLNGYSWKGKALELHETIKPSSMTIGGEEYSSTYYMDETLSTPMTDETLVAAWKESTTQTFYAKFEKGTAEKTATIEFGTIENTTAQCNQATFDTFNKSGLSLTIDAGTKCYLKEGCLLKFGSGSSEIGDTYLTLTADTNIKFTKVVLSAYGKSGSYITVNNQASQKLATTAGTDYTFDVSSDNSNSVKITTTVAAKAFHVSKIMLSYKS